MQYTAGGRGFSAVLSVLPPMSASIVGAAPAIRQRNGSGPSGFR